MLTRIITSRSQIINTISAILERLVAVCFSCFSITIVGYDAVWLLEMAFNRDHIMGNNE